MHYYLLSLLYLNHFLQLFIYNPWEKPHVIENLVAVTLVTNGLLSLAFYDEQKPMAFLLAGGFLLGNSVITNLIQALLYKLILSQSVPIAHMDYYQYVSLFFVLLFLFVFFKTLSKLKQNRLLAKPKSFKEM